MNLSPDWLAEFERRQIEAAHWSQVGDIHAPDSAIMQYAREHGFVVFTHDLDFGAMLAATGASSPSVIQIRTQNITPQFLATKFFAVAEQFQEQLSDGALIIVDTHKNRVRLLPLNP